MSLVILVCLSLAAAPTAGVVVAKRNGVSRGVALSRAEAVRSALGDSFATIAVEDLTACNGKRPCLVREARQRGWSVLVIIETATVLGDALLNAVLLSVDDDGREVERVSLQAREAELMTQLAPATQKLRAELEKLVATPVATRVETKPDPEPPAPSVKTVELSPPAPTVRSTPRVEKPATRWIPAAAGLVLLGVGIGFEVASQSLAGRLNNELFDTEATPRALAMQGQVFQTLGLSLMVGGGVVALGGLVLSLLWPEATVTPVAAFSERGGLLGVAGSWP
jgi:hypothetical protein